MLPSGSPTSCCSSCSGTPITTRTPCANTRSDMHARSGERAHRVPAGPSKRGTRPNPPTRVSRDGAARARASSLAHGDGPSDSATLSKRSGRNGRSTIALIGLTSSLTQAARAVRRNRWLIDGRPPFVCAAVCAEGRAEFDDVHEFARRLRSAAPARTTPLCDGWSLHR